MTPPHLLHLLLLLAVVPLSLSLPKGILINCGSAVKSVIHGREWLPDTEFVSGGTPHNLTGPVLVPTLSTVRSFPNDHNRKFCYTVHVYRNAKYMVRATYFYHGGDTDSPPPVFDQIVDGTLWAVVNTTDDYANGTASYYEGVFLARGKTMSVCLGSNSYTESDPFISALEFVIVEDSLYNSTDFNNFGLGLVARHVFGYTGPMFGYPDDKFDRYWEAFGGPNPVNVSNTNASVSGLWNQPPLKVFETELTTGQAETMELNWPPGSVPESRYYYIALYFALGMEGSRVFNISINGVPYYKDLDVTPEGLVVYASRWRLSGATRITLTPSAGSSGGPLINAGEVFDVLPLNGTTLTRDVIALQRVKQSLQNPPSDWNGDPCMPSQYSWTGITCSLGPRIRVVTLNLTSMGLSGSLSPSIANMTGLSDIYLGNNDLSGPIPDLSALKRLEKLHLENNHFSGDIPPSLGNIDNLHELFLQNNYLTGQVPTSLIGRPGLDLRTTGNSFSSAPPPS